MNGKQSFCGVIMLWSGEILMSVLGRKRLKFLFSFFPSFLFGVFFLLFPHVGELLKS